jgi:hypothetical protein
MPNGQLAALMENPGFGFQSALTPIYVAVFI